MITRSHTNFLIESWVGSFTHLFSVVGRCNFDVSELVDFDCEQNDKRKEEAKKYWQNFQYNLVVKAFELDKEKELWIQKCS